MAEEALPADRLKELLARIDPRVLEQVMPLTGRVITMMFTDIVDSTKVKAEIGDQAYFEALKEHNGLVRESASAHNGRELKMIGDAFLIGFPTPAEAVACAVEIQQRLTASPIQAGSGTLQVRIGVHSGTPIVYPDPVSNRIDLSGTDVDKAARVEALARGGQVLISEETKALAKPKELYDWGLWELKGLGRHRIFELLWPGKTPERPTGRPWLEPVRFLTSFVGRETDIAKVMDAVLSHRLVTLRGMGGIGKTRLADEVATRVNDEFDDGVFFVELAKIQSSENSVVSELAARLGVKQVGFPDEATALSVTLQNRRVLLVLDNFEVVMSAAPFIGRLLKGCPGLHILITSQQLLGVDGEQQIEVLPMETAAPHPSATVESFLHFDSFKLFRDRARLKRPHWNANPAEAPLLAEILELTDGIPLSIELAAARVDKGTLASIGDGLRSNRIEFLNRTGLTSEERRHAGIRACIDWTLNLLSGEEQTLFAKLSVFAGGFFPEDVAVVCSEENPSAVLESLQALSLLTWKESLGKTRYRMLPTVNEYAAQKLGDEAQPVRWRHAQRFLEVLDFADNQIRGRGQIAGIARITADLNNIRAGMETARQTGHLRTLVLYSLAFGKYLGLKHRISELLVRSQQGLLAAQALNDAQLMAGCHNNLGNACANLPTGNRGTNLQQAIGCYEAALRVYTERDFPVQRAMTQNNLGNAYRDLPTGDRGGNLHKAIACYETSLRVRTERDFPVDWATTQYNLALAYWNLPTGDRGANLRKAIACYEEALRVRTEQDFPVDWARTQTNLGVAYADLPTGDKGVNLQRAIGCYGEALRICTEEAFPIEWASIQNNMGLAYADLPTGDKGLNLQRAIGCYEAALRVRTEQDFPVDWAGTQINLGNAYADLLTGGRDVNLHKAIACYEAALRIYSDEAFPVQWATIQNNLGITYVELPTGDRLANLAKAIACYEAALRVRTEAEFPSDWAITQNNLGTACQDLPTGNRGANLQKIIACYEAAIRGYAAAGLTEEADRVRQLLASLKQQ